MIKKIFVGKMEDIIENDSKISHEALANILEEHADEPSKVLYIHTMYILYIFSMQFTAIIDRAPSVSIVQLVV
jgi:hypothetical protein